MVYFELEEILEEIHALNCHFVEKQHLLNHESMK